MSKVHYHQHGREAQVLHVVNEHQNGTVDLAYTPKGKAVIEGILLSDRPGHGKAVAIADDKEQPKSSTKQAAKKNAKPKPGLPPEGPPAPTEEEGEDDDGEEDENEDPAPSTGNDGGPPPEE